MDRINQDAHYNKSKIINPIEIYDNLTHKEGYEYLRSNQKDFLERWNANRTDKEVVGVLNTGAGKTLIGLLMLFSKMNEGAGPCLYLCPDKQLVSQVLTQSKNYGIPTINLENSELPTEFLNSEAILVTTFEKLFNGKSIFGISGFGNREIQKLGCILIDDAHSCIKKARKQMSLRIPKNSRYYKEFFNLFKEDIEKQGIAQFKAIEKNEKSVAKMIPYWAWKDKIKEIEKLIIQMNEENLDETKFVYSLIIDDLNFCQCFISGSEIEISPLLLPIKKIASFYKAKYKFILSATINNNSELINELGISYKAVLNPIEIDSIGSVGEKMILFPTKYSTEIDLKFIMSKIKKYIDEKTGNRVVLVPSKYFAKEWEKYGAEVVESKIEEKIQELHENLGKFMVFINRYDGIDLASKSCNFLIISGLPKATTTKDYALAIMRQESDYITSQRARIIEQGLGRSVRAGSDFSVILLLDSELINFVTKNSNLKYFSKYTQAQLKLGIELFNDYKRENKKISSETAWKEIRNSLNLCMKRDTKWINYHRDYLKKYEEKNIDSKQKLFWIANEEFKALELYSKKSIKKQHIKLMKYSKLKNMN